MTIDTLEYVKELEAAGVERKVAEAHARAAGKLISGEAATKMDVKTEIAALELRLIKYMVAQSIAIVGLVLALGGFLIRFLR